MRKPNRTIAALALAVALSACSQDDDTTITTEYALRNDMRELWTAHVTWTRVFLIDAIADLPDTPNATQRLLRNQDDIGNAVRPFYGDAAADRLTALLREHITGAAEVVAAASAGDTARLSAASDAWYANADEIAAFLAAANPHWAEADLRAMMHTHLDQTIVEATARLTGDWAADAAAYDAIVEHILAMADVLAAGIADQFPQLVSRDSGMSVENEDLHRGMRVLWQDHVTWTRVVIIDMLADLPDTSVAVDRLLRNQDDIGNAFRPLYGDAAADQLTALLREHITGAAEVVTAARAGDSQRLETAMTAWVANADAIASFLASANSHWSEDDLREMMHTHLEQTTAEATARLESDWERDIATYDAIVTHILHMSDALSDGVAAQFPEQLGSTTLSGHLHATH